MNDFQKQIWLNNYKAPEDNTIEDTWKRIAKAVSLAQKDEKTQTIMEQQFYQVLSEWKFIPGGRITANIGVKSRDKATAYNCYVYNPQDFGIKDIDSMQGIFESLKKSAKILASEGGLGINVTYVRPNGSYIVGTGARTPGVVKFLQLWDKTSEIITMGSTRNIKDKNVEIEKKKIRKGAMIAVLDISHSDIKDFITVKQISNKLTKFNMSILIPDRFMKAVQHNDNWQLCFPDTNYDGYKNQWDGDLQRWIVSGKPVIISQTLPAKQLWDLIMLSTYNRNQPGVLFYDTLNDYNPVNYCERILATNPCAQIGMPSNVCNLGALNLPMFYYDNKFDFDSFEQVIKTSVCFLDNICDISYVPLKDYEQKIKDKRRIGLGVTGLGSLLYMMGIKFGSYQAIQFTNNIFRFKAQIELLTSAFLGKIKGSFLAFDKEKYFNSKWWFQIPISYKTKKEIENIGQMRNSVHSAIAPVGNGSIFAGQVSNGIQPVFMKEYTRWVVMTDKQKQTLEQVHKNIQVDQLNPYSDLRTDIPQFQKIPNPQLGQWWQTFIFKFAIRGNQQILRGEIDGVTYEIDKNRGLIKPVQVIDYGWKYVLQHKYDNKNYEWCVTTQQLSIDEHLNMLQASAKFVNQNQSKTINIPAQYSYESFKNVYLNAWRKKIKGITTYRAGTMTAVLQAKKQVQQYQSQLEKLFKQANGNVIQNEVMIPNKSYALQYKVKDNNKKKWYFTITFANKQLTKPFAFFIRTNQRESNQVTDLIIQAVQSLLLSQGINENLIIEQREKYQNQTNVDKIGRSISMALRHNIEIVKIVKVLDDHADGLSTLIFHIRKVLSSYIKDGTKIVGKVCDNCQSDQLIFEAGCFMCASCGMSKCS